MQEKFRFNGVQQVQTLSSGNKLSTMVLRQSSVHKLTNEARFAIRSALYSL